MPSASVPFFRPSIGVAEREQVLEVLDSGWLTSGPKVEQFEEAFATAVGASHAVAVNSCTAAMHLALVASAVGPGDEVIVPAMTFTATAEVVVHVGATPILVDVDPGTLSIDPAAAADAVTDATSVVMPMHYGGQACDLDGLRAAVGEDIEVIADAAHAFPTRASDGMVGGKGAADATAFSFYANKTITTGEGGMLTTENAELANRVRRLSLHGMSGDAHRRSQSPAPWNYDVVEPGFKNNLPDLAAALGLAQLARAEDLAELRRSLADRYTRALADDELVTTLTVDRPEDSAWHLFVARLELAALDCDRDHIISQLGEAGIGASVHYKPLHLHAWYRETFGYERSDFPVAADAFDRIISLPLYPDLTVDEVDRVVDVFTGCLADHRR
jgi:dTDP-4-amino-4,6-dideoxygalactose transaminase